MLLIVAVNYIHTLIYLTHFTTIHSLDDYQALTSTVTVCSAWCLLLYMHTLKHQYINMAYYYLCAKQRTLWTTNNFVSH